MRTIERIYITETGTQIDLQKIVAIGCIEKDQMNIIFFNVYLSGLTNPLKFIAGHSLGTASDQIKKNVEASLNKLSDAWHIYISLTS
jgi:hypothetical protein